MKKIYYFFLLFSASICLNAQLKSYSYYRDIKPVTKTGFYEMKIGSAIIDRDGHYRVYEVNAADTVEVPHVKEDQLFYSYDRSYFKQLKLIDESFEKDKASYVTLVLDTNLIYNTIYLNIADGDYFKDVTIEGCNDNKNFKTIIENEKIFNYYKGADDHYYRNKISFKDISFKYLRLRFEDERSLKISLKGAYIPIDKQYNITSGELVGGTLSRSEDKTNKQTILEYSLPRKYLISILNFNIKHSQPHYKREYTVSLLDNGRKKDNWVYFGGGTLHPETDNSIVLNNYSNNAAFKSDKIKIAISNLDDVPLKDVALEVFTHEEKIKLKLEAGKKYVLAYGKPNDQSPQYDMENFKNSIPFALPIIEAGIENSIPQLAEVKPQPLVSSNKWIWVALVVCIALIGLFTVKLLNPGSEEK